MTKIAFGCDSIEYLRERIEMRAEAGIFALTTRYLPKRHAEMKGGSLYWIVAHRLVARSPLIGFADSGDGRTLIQLKAELITVQPRPKRAHQGWRYLDEKDAPVDFDGSGDGSEQMPGPMLSELTRLGLV